MKLSFPTKSPISVMHSYANFISFSCFQMTFNLFKSFLLFCFFLLLFSPSAQMLAHRYVCVGINGDWRLAQFIFIFLLASTFINLIKKIAQTISYFPSNIFLFIFFISFEIFCFIFVWWNVTLFEMKWENAFATDLLDLEIYENVQNVGI